MNLEERLFHVERRGWYVRTTIVPEGPFATHIEAARYLALVETVSAAGIACGWPAPHTTAETPERSSNMLFVIALAGLAWVRRRRRNHARPVH